MTGDRRALAARLQERFRRVPVTTFRGDGSEEVRFILTSEERDQLVDLLAALGAEAEPRGWQDIATAPKDRPILGVSPLASHGWAVVAQWDDDEWINADGAKVDIYAWLDYAPLPSPPVSGREEAK